MMIRALLSVAGPRAQRALRRNLGGLVAESVLLGAGFALLVPLFRALLAGNVDAAWGWLGATGGALAVYAVVRYRTQGAGYRAAIGLGGALFERLGDHVARLPLGWFEASRVGSVGRLTSKGVIDVMGVPAHLLRPVVTSFVTPATVVVLMFAFDWRLALAALVTAPVAALVYRWFGNLVQRTDHRTDAAAVGAAGRIVEYAQAQAVLRAFGRATQGFRQLDDALREQRNAGRAQILTAAPGLAVFVLVVQLAFTILLLFGTSLTLGGEIDAPELLAMLVLGARFWDVDAGAVRVGESHVRDLTTEDLMARLSAVFQGVYLFNGTIEENIRIGRPDASDEEVREAARLASVDEIVARLPEGFATRVGEGGTALSGGERQRVSIARAILKDAPIVLLDEATAALDPVNEAAVQRGLRVLTQDKTLVVVAHRLQTVRAADRILVLDRGRIVEQGSHDELLATGGRYAAFWNERSRAAGWRITRARWGGRIRSGQSLNIVVDGRVYGRTCRRSTEAEYANASPRRGAPQYSAGARQGAGRSGRANPRYRAAAEPERPSSDGDQGYQRPVTHVQTGGGLGSRAGRLQSLPVG